MRKCGTSCSSAPYRLRNSWKVPENACPGSAYQNCNVSACMLGLLTLPETSSSSNCLTLESIGRIVYHALMSLQNCACRSRYDLLSVSAVITAAEDCYIWPWQGRLATCEWHLIV